MSYNTRVTGEIRINPPLSWAEIKREKFHLEGHYEINLILDHDTRDTDTGQETVITGFLLKPDNEHAKNYHIVEHLQRFADTYARKGRTLTGYFECEGEEQPDMWRLVIVEGKAKVVRAAVLWPEDVTDLAETIALAASSAEPTQAMLGDVVVAAHALVTRLRETFAKQDRH